VIRRDQIQQVKIPHNPLQLYFQSSCGGNKPNKPCKGSGVECNVLRVPTLSQVETDERATVLVTPEVRTDGHHETPLSRFGTYQRPQAGRAASLATSRRNRFIQPRDGKKTMQATCPTQSTKRAYRAEKDRRW